MGYARSPSRDFESYVKNFVDLDEKNIQLILKDYNSYFITYGIPQCIYLIKDIPEVDYTKGDQEVTKPIEYDDTSMRTNNILNRFELTFETPRFEEKSFFKTSLDFAAYCDYKPTNGIHADSLGVYTNEKILISCTIDKIDLKCDVIDGSVVGGLRQPTLFNFVLDKLPGYEVFYEPETVHYNKINKSVLCTITFFRG